jgi:lysyl-tRNA synthetase class 2
MSTNSSHISIFYLDLSMVSRKKGQQQINLIQTSNLSIGCHFFLTIEIAITTSFFAMSQPTAARSTEQVLPQGFTQGENGEILDADGNIATKSKLKAVLKVEQRQAAKEKKAAAQPPSQKEETATEPEVDARQFYERRLKTVTRQLARARAGEDVLSPYPHYFPTTEQISEFCDTYKGLAASQELPEIEVRLAGRIYSKRMYGKLAFLDVYQGQVKVQVILRTQSWHDPAAFKREFDAFYLGDIVGVEGFPGRSKTGELSLIGRKVILLSPCIHQWPSEFKDTELRFRQRFLDLVVNRENQEIFVTRARMISALRRFLDERGFIEIETPVM